MLDGTYRNLSINDMSNNIFNTPFVHFYFFFSSSILVTFVEYTLNNISTSSEPCLAL